MNVLELFAGSATFSFVAQQLDHRTYTSDIEAFLNIDYVILIVFSYIATTPYVWLYMSVMV